jgi:predicted RNase H-like nuclease (RuvC/YqgF family)
MNLDEFKNKWLGKPADFDGAYGNQCVDLYRFYVHEVLGFPQSPGVGGAAEIWDSADPKYYDFITNNPKDTDQFPTPGDIVIWNRKMGSGAGHVAIVLGGTTGSTLHVLETDGTTGTGLVQEKLRPYTNVIGWLHPKESMGTINLETTKFEELVKKSTQWDKTVNYLKPGSDPTFTSFEDLQTIVAGLKSRATDSENKLTQCQAELKNREEQVSRLKEEIAAGESMRIDLQNQLNNTSKKVDEMMGVYEGKLTDLKGQVNTLASEKGELNKTIAQLELEIKRLNDRINELIKNCTTDITLWDAIKLIGLWFTRRAKGINLRSTDDTTPVPTIEKPI